MDIYNDGALPHGSFAATTSDAILRNFESFKPSNRVKTLNQFNPDNSPKKSVDTKDFDTASARIQVETQTLGVPDNAPASGITLSFNSGHGIETWRLQTVDGPAYDIGVAWVWDTTWQKNVN